MTEELKISQKLHSSMIGPGGKLILSITAECGDVNIRFPQDNTTSDIITIRGTQEDVDKAKVRLLILPFFLLFVKISYIIIYFPAQAYYWKNIVLSY